VKVFYEVSSAVFDLKYCTGERQKSCLDSQEKT